MHPGQFSTRIAGKRWSIFGERQHIAIGDRPPEQYFAELLRQADGGKKKYGGITDRNELRANLRAHCIPESMLEGEVPDYDDFLAERRRLMALKIRSWFEAL